uniref:Ras homolog family member F, filopodia associated n=1 Tax=Pelodiscus sinensis TaxID=13735 RepID=K7GFP9_PELSI|nr:rho-related GTP-binding protein RhoF-like [Pelodiscus sinensis]|eukprot:XP_006136442.1 rho-related GTP-binding protein RhoF-like [Pelodiscus sinensis]
MQRGDRAQSRMAGGAEMGPTEIKAVIVGDGGCGKTSLLMVFAKGDFPKIYVPTVFEKYSASFQVGDKPVQINLWDTAGQEDYDRLRPLSYPGAHVILMCFDVTSPATFDNILTKWYPEVNHFCRGVPIVLVGCKTDLRMDKVLLRRLHEDRLEPITYLKAEAMAQDVHAVAYLECSAKFQENITDIFLEASRAALSAMRKSQSKQKPKRSCLLS